MSLIGDSCNTIGRSTSVTTGQGGEGNWRSRGLGKQASSNLGNSRAPHPTCNIPVSVRATGTKLLMPVPNDQSWLPKAADNVVGDSGCRRLTPASAGPGLNGASASMESTQDDTPFRGAILTHGTLDDGLDGSQQDISDAREEDSELQGIKPRAAYKRSRKGKEKKKVGRPIAYRGDPNAPELTDQERRRIKRRIANRESARRVRHKRQEELEDMQIKMEQIQAHNTQLQQHAQHICEQKELLANQLEEMEKKYKKLAVENKHLTIEIQALRQSLQLKMSALEDELDKRANEAEGNTVVHSAFASPGLQSLPLGALPVTQDGSLPPVPMDPHKTCPSLPLDWFPSLNLEDFRTQDMGHSLFDEPQTGLCIKREAVNENLTFGGA